MGQSLLQNGLFQRGKVNQNPACSEILEDAISHYLTGGRAHGLSPSILFSEKYYLLANPDVARAAADPFWHFVNHGMGEKRAGNDPELIRQYNAVLDSGLFELDTFTGCYGRAFRSVSRAVEEYLSVKDPRKPSPSEQFDSRFYLSTYGDISAANVDPFVHYVMQGKSEGRKAKLSRSRPAAKPKAPPFAEWQTLASSVDNSASNVIGEQTDDVDVIIPVYRGYDDTLACIDSVLRSKTKISYRLIVVNDCSPEDALSEELRRLARLELIMLLENDENLGFVKTANRGMLMSKSADVVLLNSDTIVYDNWLDRLRACAYANNSIATVTPFSNNATIFSYPFFNEINNQELEISFEELDEIFAKENKGLFAPVPTGVGYCFYIKRLVIDLIGALDVSLFDKGYGEENEYCMRVIEAGYQNVAALDLFVRHTGEVSFGAGASAGKRRGHRRLSSAYPTYDDMVAEAVTVDVFREARTRVDIARIRNDANGQCILMIEHGWGGGIKRHIDDIATLLKQEGVVVLVGKPSDKRGVFDISVYGVDDFPNLPTIDWIDQDRSAALLNDLGVSAVHIHSFAGSDAIVIDHVRSSLQRSGIPYWFTAHDYVSICPRLTMTDRSGAYCDSPSVEYCKMCLQKDGSPFGMVDVQEWRLSYQSLINDAEAIIVPHDNVAARLRQHIDLQTQVLVRSHPKIDKCELKQTAHRSRAERRVGLIGSIGPHKGARLLEALCADAIERKLPISFVVYGQTDFAHRSSRYKNLTVTGNYQEEKLGEIFAKDPSDILLYASVCPETFCYTLDFAFDVGVMPVCFDLGTPADRIRQTRFGQIMSASWIYDAGSVNDYLLSVDIAEPTRPISEVDRGWKSASAFYGQGFHGSSSLNQ